MHRKEGGMASVTSGTLFLKHTQIIIYLPDGTEQRITLAGTTIRIGRGIENNDVTLPSELRSISRRHLEIRFENGAYRVYDLESGNGVWMNGQRVVSATLNDGDEIIIGQGTEQVRIQYQAGTDMLASNEGTLAIPTQMDLPSSMPQGTPAIAVRLPNGKIVFFAVVKDFIIAGRTSEADLVLAYPFVSARHFELRRLENEYTITDLESTNGTLLNNMKLTAGRQTTIHHNDIIRIGDDSFGISLGLTFKNPAEPPAPQEGFTIAAPTMMMEAEETITIGRAIECDIRLDTPMVSRHHARITKRDSIYCLEDLGSKNGTFVNDKLVKLAELIDGDIIRISNFLLVFDDGNVTPFQSNGMRLDVSGLSRDVPIRGGKLRIMDNISMSVLPREFVALVGGSGAGKTTLLNALVGIHPGNGQVQLNGQDFYQEYEHFRDQLGFVPQNDILHTALTVEKALDYTARLRLPASVNADERKKRIAAVLETVSMNTETIRETRISNLSGGQRKRVSIAAELLADPKLIYLDEATSGLDPGLEKKMMHTLRRMADEGRTVILITHATDNIVQSDHVAFLSQGRLIFFGPSQEALDFFEVEDFADIYEKIEHSGEQWRKTFQDTKPQAYQKYVLARQASAQATPARQMPKVHFGLGQLLRQFFVLSQRSLSVLLSDPVTLILMLLLLPLTGTLQLIIGSRDVLTGNPAILADPVNAAKTLLENYAPYAKTNTFVFVMGLEAVLTGLFVPSNDLVKERNIFLRERMVNLKVLPYLLSKAAIYTIFVIIQVVLYLLILSIGVNFPENGLYFPGVIELFITLFLTMMAGITFGFILSAISKNTEMAIYLLTMMLFFQFFFAGTVFDLRGNAFEPLSYLSTTRWSLTALGVTIDMPKLVESTILCTDTPVNPFDPNSDKKIVCENYVDATKDLMIDYSDRMLLISWEVLAGMCVLFMTLTGVLLSRTKSD
jgi:ABC-type multidrug transport system ATPase subunit/pSer/pThr/pTyr-binding forkhead associated (FHA) protein